MQVIDRIEEQYKKATRSSAKTDVEDMDILDKLGKEHDEVQALLGQLVESEKAAERTRLLKQIKAALVPHTKAEQKVVYDRVLKLKDRDAKIDGNEGYLEHEIAERTLTQLGKIRNRVSPEFSAAAKVLKELVNHHIQEEENAIWSDVKNNFSDQDRIEMNREFEAAKKRVKVA
jgi:hemerythrin superfamily protein